MASNGKEFVRSVWPYKCHSNRSCSLTIDSLLEMASASGTDGLRGDGGVGNVMASPPDSAMEQDCIIHAQVMHK